MFTARDYAMMLEPLVKHWFSPVLTELALDFAPWLNFTVSPFVIRVLASVQDVYTCAFILYMLYSIVAFFMTTLVKPAFYVVSTIINLPWRLISLVSYLLSSSNHQHQQTITVHVTPYYDYKLDRKYTFELPSYHRLSLNDVLRKTMANTIYKTATVCSVLVHHNDGVKEVKDLDKYQPEQDDNIMVFLTKE
jgi:hypothetical protein